MSWQADWRERVERGHGALLPSSEALFRLALKRPGFGFVRHPAIWLMRLDMALFRAGLVR